MIEGGTVVFPGIGAELGVLIGAATVFAVAAAWLRQPTIVAYVVTGIVVGPAGMGLVESTDLIAVMGELGLALLLFLIGMEMNVREIRHMLDDILEIAAGMMISLFALGVLVSLLLGFNPVAAAVIGLSVMYGSTAVVVKLLTDKHENTVTSGKLDIGILLVEDIVVIILMAVLLAQATTWYGFATSTVMILGTLLLIAGIAIESGRTILPPLFREMAENPHYLLVTGLAWCFGFMYAADFAGLSPEIGAFLAGLGLAQLPYSMELRERVRPLTAFFMALFLVDFGLGLSLSAFTAYWREALIAAGVLMAGKCGIIFLLVKRQRYTLRTSFKAAVNMAQTSEFSLIFGAVAATAPLTAEHVGDAVIGFLSIIAITTMSLSSYLIVYNNQIFERIRPLLERVMGEQRKIDVEQPAFTDHAVLLGYTEQAAAVLPVLEEYVDTIVVVEHDPDAAAALSETPHEHIFGDVRHPELREDARLGAARVVISFDTRYGVNAEVLRETPDVGTRIVSAETQEDRDRLYGDGADHVLLRHELTGTALAGYVTDALETVEVDSG